MGSQETLLHHYLAALGGGLPGKPCEDGTKFLQAPCFNSLWCCQWYDGCWADVDDKQCPLVSPACAIAGEDRTRCGWPGINKAECKMLQCCWDPLSQDADSHPSCF